MRRDRRDALIAELRQQAEELRLRIVESGGAIMVTQLGAVVFKARDVNSVQLFLELRRVSV